MKPVPWLALCALVPVFAGGQGSIHKVPVNVLNRNRIAIASVQPEACQSRIQKYIIPIRAVEHVAYRRILVMVDESGSMAPSNDFGSCLGQAMQNVKETLTQLLSELPAGSSGAYGLFNKKMLLTDGFISDPQELTRAI